MTSGSLSNYYRDRNNDDENDNANNRINNKQIFWIKEKNNMKNTR